MEIACLTKTLRRSCESASNMIPLSCCSNNSITRKIHTDRISYPISKNNFSGDWLRAIISIKLNIKMISLHQSINCESFIHRISVTLSSDHKRNLTWLKVKIYWSKCYYGCISWIISIICTTLCLNIPIKIAPRNSICIYVWKWKIRNDFYYNFSISQHIGLR